MRFLGAVWSLDSGAGWLPSDYSAFGYPFDHRVSRFAEAIEIIHGLLRNDTVTFHGSTTTLRSAKSVREDRGPEESRS